MTTPTRSKLLLDGVNPTCWAEYVGQAAAKQQLQIAIASAQRRGAPLDHVLLASGQQGIGKTSLALVVAAEMGVPAQVRGGKISQAEGIAALRALPEGGVLFIDEIHKLVDGGKAGAEWLLNYMENGTVLTSKGSVPVPRVTIIGATTDAARLPKTILDRFIHRPQLVRLSEKEAAMLAVSMSAKIFPGAIPVPLGLRASHRVAIAADHNPRRIKRILYQLRDIGAAEGWTREDGEFDISLAISFVATCPDGLTYDAERYLQVACGTFGGLVGGDTIAEQLNEPAGCAETERLLIDKGFLVRTPNGRQVTSRGWERAKQVLR